jgi:hypothetical protein
MLEPTTDTSGIVLEGSDPMAPHAADHERDLLCRLVLPDTDDEPPVFLEYRGGLPVAPPGCLYLVGPELRMVARPTSVVTSTGRDPRAPDGFAQHGRMVDDVGIPCRA